MRHSIANENAGVEYQLLQPPKAVAMAYLKGETMTPPARYAKVTVYRGGETPRDVMQYKVRWGGGVAVTTACSMHRPPLHTAL